MIQSSSGKNRVKLDSCLVITKHHHHATLGFAILILDSQRRSIAITAKEPELDRLSWGIHMLNTTQCPCLWSSHHSDSETEMPCTSSCRAVLLVKLLKKRDLTIWCWLFGELTIVGVCIHNLERPQC